MKKNKYLISFFKNEIYQLPIGLLYIIGLCTLSYYLLLFVLFLFIIFMCRRYYFMIKIGWYS